MMILKTALGVAASLGLMTSTAAIAQTATSSTQISKTRALPTSKLRTATSVRKASGQTETGIAPIVIGVGAAAAIGLGIAVVATEDDEPDSPG